MTLEQRPERPRKHAMVAELEEEHPGKGPSRGRGLKPERTDWGTFQISSSHDASVMLRVKAPVLPSGIASQAIHSQGDLKPNPGIDSLCDLTLVSQPLWSWSCNSYSGLSILQEGTARGARPWGCPQSAVLCKTHPPPLSTPSHHSHTHTSNTTQDWYSCQNSY